MIKLHHVLPRDQANPQIQNLGQFQQASFFNIHTMGPLVYYHTIFQYCSIKKVNVLL